MDRRGARAFLPPGTRNGASVATLAIACQCSVFARQTEAGRRRFSLECSFRRNGGPFAAEGGHKELRKPWEGSAGAAASSAA
jgi:hypothetical protein